MNKKIVFLFSGQGTQYYHMARELFARHTLFKKWMLRLNNIVHDVAGESALEEIYDEHKTQGDRFDRITYSHPAIFMVEYSMSQVLKLNGIIPDYVLGTSMGEFAAAALSGVMSAEELLKILLKQAEDIEEYCEPGGMLAIIHDAGMYEKTPLIRDNSELASINYDSHFVIAGKEARLQEIERYLKQKNILYQTLPVRYGFHSSCIDPAASAFKQFLSSRLCQPPDTSFISGLLGGRLKKTSSEYFWDAVRMPIRFREAFQELERRGDNIYIDLGPGGSLANFAKRNMLEASNSESHAIITPFHQELRNLEKIRMLCAAKTSCTHKGRQNENIRFSGPGITAQRHGREPLR